jgi:hypothetical protein
MATLIAAARSRPHCARSWMLEHWNSFQHAQVKTAAFRPRDGTVRTKRITAPGASATRSGRRKTRRLRPLSGLSRRLSKFVSFENANPRSMGLPRICVQRAERHLRSHVRKCFVHRMALAKLTPQCAAAWRHDMSPSTAFSTLSRTLSLILLVDVRVRGVLAFLAQFRAVVGLTP